jgi:hypothetical protein
LLSNPLHITAPELLEGDHARVRLRRGSQDRVAGNRRQPHLEKIDLAPAAAKADGAEPEHPAAIDPRTAGLVDEDDITEVEENGCRRVGNDRQIHRIRGVAPPATLASGRSVSPIRRRTRPVSIPRASAAIWVSAVQVPVPISAPAKASGRSHRGLSRRVATVTAIRRPADVSPPGRGYVPAGR